MVDTAVETPSRSRATRASSGGLVVARSGWITAAALSGYVALLVVASRWGESLLAHGTRLQISTPPLNGTLDWRPGATAIPAVACAFVAVLGYPRLVRRSRWSTVLVVAGLGAIGWAITLALVDGSQALVQPSSANEYLRTAMHVGDLGSFLATFTHRISDYNIHTQGHPPGMVVVLWLMHAVGLGGVRWNSVLVYAGGGVGVVATLVAVREVAGEDLARRAAPFLVLAPAGVMWTSGDPFFAGVSACAVTALILATGKTGQRSDVLAFAGGLLFALTAFLSYGLVLLAIVPVVVAVRRRQYRVLEVAAGTVVVVVLAVWIGTGFAWWGGLVATRVRYFAGAGGRRPYDYFLLANLAAFAIAIGPATVVALTRLRRNPLAVLVGAAVAAVLLADMSGMSKAEVERIWLPFVPWVMAAGAVLATQVRSTRVWLTIQASGALLLAVAIRSPW